MAEFLLHIHRIKLKINYMNALSKLKPKIKPYEEDAEIIIFSNLYLITYKL